MAAPIGIMQGRLLPKYLGRYQAHPKGYWHDEFAVAAGLGLEIIEFILDFEAAEENPLLADGGIDAIAAASAATGVGVRTICADYFMAAPLHGADATRAAESARILGRLFDAAERLGVTDIVIPCVDNSRFRDDADVARFLRQIEPFVERAERIGINLALETDLAPRPFVALLDAAGSRRVSVNYDTGNSASLGFDPRAELDAYGDRITDMHIKDRTLGGGPVLLGDGNADFSVIRSWLEDTAYAGPIIFQAYRDDEGVGIFKRQFDWFLDHVAPRELEARHG